MGAARALHIFTRTYVNGTEQSIVGAHMYELKGGMSSISVATFRSHPAFTCSGMRLGELPRQLLQREGKEHGLKGFSNKAANPFPSDSPKYLSTAETTSHLYAFQAGHEW
jgi:hypothetical protein